MRRLGQVRDTRPAASTHVRSTLVGGLVCIFMASCSVCAQELRQSVPSSDPLPITGTSNAAFGSLDNLMRSFVAEHDVPGAALAVAKHGRLIYARGFGYADRERQIAVEPVSLFRIASISKPITAVAVLGLCEQGKLDLDERVFDVLGLGDRVVDPERLDPRWREVTIRHLLQHTGGWDRDVSFDPMFQQLSFALRAGGSPPARPNQIIQAMLDYPLDYDPGTRFAYSNFGYCLLGRVIENRSGGPYEDYIREQILRPLGLDQSMRMGRTLVDQRAPGEVRYYVPGNATAPSVFAEQIGGSVSKPYGNWCMETLDSHGGWIGSAVDLVRFGSACDPTSTAPLLSPNSFEQMFARPDALVPRTARTRPRGDYYGMGWQVRPAGNRGVNAWHTGMLPGTSALLVRRYDGFCWAVLFNTHVSQNGESLSAAIDRPMHEAANLLPRWPESAFSRQPPMDAGRRLSEFQSELLDLAFPTDPLARP